MKLTLPGLQNSLHGDAVIPGYGIDPDSDTDPDPEKKRISLRSIRHENKSSSFLLNFPCSHFYQPKIFHTVKKVRILNGQSV
jgi:hypothetical protein